MLPDTDTKQRPTQAQIADADRAAIRAATIAQRRRRASIWGVRTVLVVVGLSAWEFAARYWVDFDGRTLIVGSHRPPGAPAIDYDPTVRAMAAAVTPL